MVRTTGLKNYSDVHLTNIAVAKQIVEFFQPTLPCLEPCAGEGAFLEFLPSGTKWCEIQKGVDFFQFNDYVNWIVTNPPFEELTKWMEKAFAISNNVVFLMPLSKLYSSVPRLKLVKEYGGVKTILYFGSGRQIGFDIGFPFGAIHFQKGYTGDTRTIWDTEKDDQALERITRKSYT